MEINETNCCALDELTDINHCKSPEDVLRELGNYIYAERPHYYEDDEARQKPAAFYLFTGVEKVKKGSDDPVGKLAYASALAAYIKANKLGSVVKSVRRYNRKFHPTHLDQVFVWAPSDKAFRSWWANNKLEVQQNRRSKWS